MEHFSKCARVGGGEGGLFLSVCTFVCLRATYFKCLNSLLIFTKLRTNIISLEDTSDCMFEFTPLGYRIKSHL
jgi:hypothetical protein